MTAHLPQQTQKRKTKRSDSEFQMCRAHLFISVLKYHMELIFNHRFGRIDHQTLTVSDILALPDQRSGNETDMIDSGWLALDRPYYIHSSYREVFYQCRSTRVDLDLSRPRFAKHLHNGRRIEMKEIFPRRREDTVWTGMHQIYRQYLVRKGLRNLHDPFEHIHKRDSFLIYFIGDVSNLVGFTKIKRYQWQEEYYDDLMMAPEYFYSSEPSGIHAVVRCNAVPIGPMTMDMEIAWAKKQSASYYYGGPGYERSSIFKSEWKGFEWWTGSRWSRGKREYKRLCERDSQLRSISEL